MKIKKLINQIAKNATEINKESLIVRQFTAGELAEEEGIKVEEEYKNEKIWIPIEKRGAAINIEASEKMFRLTSGIIVSRRIANAFGDGEECTKNRWMIPLV